MTEHVKNNNRLKWILLLVCLGINALVVHHSVSGESNLIFTKGPSQNNVGAFLYSALLSTGALVMAIYLSLENFQSSSKINFGILILILINLFFTGFHILINIANWAFSTPNNGF